MFCGDACPSSRGHFSFSMCIHKYFVVRGLFVVNVNHFFYIVMEDH